MYVRYCVVVLVFWCWFVFLLFYWWGCGVWVGGGVVVGGWGGGGVWVGGGGGGGA